MVCYFKLGPHDILDNYISVKTAANYSGYNEQYIRRLLRRGKINSKKIGQIWLIKFNDFDCYLKNAIKSEDSRFGPN